MIFFIVAKNNFPQCCFWCLARICYTGKSMKQEVYMTWSAPEHPHKEKRADWYVALGIVAVSGSVAAFLLENPLFALIILISAFALALQGAQKPKVVEIAIGNRGIAVGKTLYVWSALSSFWVEEDGATPALLLAPENKFLPLVILPVFDHAPEGVRELLSEFLDEQEHRTPFVNKAMEYLGF